MASIVEARGLTKRSPGGVTALDAVDLDLPAGRVGLVGANGAGKTTLFRLLLGLTRPDAGTVEVNGTAVADDPIGVRSRIGYMPEHDCLPLDQTAADVVSTFGELSGLPARAARQRAADTLHLVRIDQGRAPSPAAASTKRASAGSGASPRACGSPRSSRRRSSATPSWSCSTSRRPD